MLTTLCNIIVNKENTIDIMKIIKKPNHNTKY